MRELFSIIRILRIPPLKGAGGYFLTIFLILASCEKSIFNAGDIVTHEIKLNREFNTIEVQNVFDIQLVNDSVNKVLVTCGENLQPDVHIEIIDNTLYLDNSTTQNWSRNYDKIKLELHLISTSYINVRKPCHIFTVDTFKSDNFILVDWGRFTDLNVKLDVHSVSVQVSSDNFGRYILKGKANFADFSGRGSIFLYADSMKVKNCNVRNTGIGDIYVNALEILTVSLESTGNIYYTGSPDSIVSKHTSSGRLIEMK